MLLILLLPRGKLERIWVLLSISEELCKSRWVISYQKALTSANKIEKGKKTTMQSCGGDLKMITEEKISLRKPGQAKKSTTVAHLSLLLKCITNTCECWTHWLCRSWEFCASRWIVASYGIGRQFLVSVFFRSSACFTNKNKLCLFAHQGFVGREGAWFPPCLLQPRQRWCPLTAEYYHGHPRSTFTEFGIKEFWDLWTEHIYYIRVLRNKSGNAHTSRRKTVCFPEHQLV